MRYGGAVEAGQLVLAGFFIRPIERGMATRSSPTTALMAVSLFFA